MSFDFDFDDRRPELSDRVRAAANDALTKVRAAEPVLQMLMELPGIGRALARRIVDRFGPEGAIEVVRDDTYRLVDIEGIGFTTADGIAIAGGRSPEANERIEAGIVHAVDVYCNGSGHTFIVGGRLEEEALKVLGVAPELIRAGLARLLAQRSPRLVVRGEHITTAALFNAEEGVARDIKRIADSPAGDVGPMAKLRIFNTNRKTLTEAVEETLAALTGITLSDSQSAAVRAIASTKVLVITGGPGTGKTTVLRVICDALRSARMTVSCAAPTGRAAKRMKESTGREASTIHAMLGMKPGTPPVFGPTNTLPSDVVVIDECSMVDVRMMHRITRAIDDRARLILIGDVDQLPSIGPGAVLRDVIASGVVPTVRLGQVFRQAKGSKIHINAQAINRGEMPVGDAGKGGEFYCLNDVTSPTTAADLVVEMATNRIPAAFGIDARTEVQVLCPRKGGPDGVVELNRRIQNIVNPSSDTLMGFRVGDRAMNTQNDYGRSVVNGDVGFVTRLERHECEHAKDRSKRVAKCKCNVVVRFDPENDVPYDVNSVERLSLAYAVTVHKSQGGEYKAVVMPVLGGRLSRNMIYTGVTRGKSVVVIASSTEILRKALSVTNLDDRSTQLASLLAA